MITREFLLSISADAEYMRGLILASLKDWPDCSYDLLPAVARLDQLIAAIRGDAATAAMLAKAATRNP
jgi:hypothetical protein